MRPKEAHSSTLVEDASYANVTSAWLFGFDIDSAELKTGYKEWLYNSIVYPLDLVNIGFPPSSQRCDETREIVVKKLTGARA